MPLPLGKFVEFTGFKLNNWDGTAQDTQEGWPKIGAIGQIVTGDCIAPDYYMLYTVKFDRRGPVEIQLWEDEFHEIPSAVDFYDLDLSPEDVRKAGLS